MSNETTANQNPEAIRSDIDKTRENMDQTIDALADRFHGKHIVDEMVGFFRSNAWPTAEKASQIKDRLADSTSRAFSSIADTVKRHPVPTALIGAGAAYIIYKSVQASRDASSDELEGPYSDEFADVPGYELRGEEYVPVDLDEYSTRQSDEASAGSKTSGIAGRGSDALHKTTDGIRGAASKVSDKVRQGAETARQRVGEVSSRVQETTRKAYEQGRDRIVDTAQNRPVEMGIGLLTVGLLVGLALPTPRRVDRLVGPRADQLRKRAQDLGKELLSRSRNVVHAATEAARKEAQSQGLTTSGLSEKARAVGRATTDAAVSSARTEGSVAFAAESQPSQPAADGLQSSNAAEI